MFPQGMTTWQSLDTEEQTGRELGVCKDFAVDLDRRYLNSNVHSYRKKENAFWLLTEFFVGGISSSDFSGNSTHSEKMFQSVFIGICIACLPGKAPARRQVDKQLTVLMTGAAVDSLKRLSSSGLCRITDTTENKIKIVKRWQLGSIDPIPTTISRKNYTISNK